MSNDRDPAPRDGETPAGDAADETSSAAVDSSGPTVSAPTGPDAGVPRAAAGSARAAARATAGARPAPKARRTVTVAADGEPTTAEPTDTDDADGRTTGPAPARDDGKGAPTRRRAEAGVGESRGNIFVRLRRFLREVVAELRKVIWPSRKQMITYTIVVIVFVSVMVAYVAGLDVLFARAVLAIFG